MNQSHIRNFAIIAHIDHGKSTLADRLMEMTGTVKQRDMQAQLLDSNPIERERGITIKLAPVRMMYRGSKQQVVSSKGMEDSSKQQVASSKDEEDVFLTTDYLLPATNSLLPTTDSAYTLNLIDTPGHVDFSYEVSRSLAACEGAILVVDATQGVQAQTLANLQKAREQKLTIVPVINKIDMPNARVEETARELEALGFAPLLSYPSLPSDSSRPSPLLISAKTGQGVGELLDAIIDRIPPPSGGVNAPLRALVFSSQYDDHKGVIVFVRVVDGSIGFSNPSDPSNPSYPSSRIRFMASGAQVSPIEIGYFLPFLSSRPSLSAGEVGYIATGLKDARLAKVGDTITQVTSHKSCLAGRQAKVKSEQEPSSLSILHSPFSILDSVTPLPGYSPPHPMVFLGLYPIRSDDITLAREAMERLRLSDAAFTFKPIHSAALGNGFHCGFLGLLHAEIVQERLLREFGLSMIATAPSVEYRIRMKNEELRMEKIIQSAAEFPNPSSIEETREPIMRVIVYAPIRFVGTIMQLCQEKRADYIDMKYMGVHGDEVPNRTSTTSSGSGQAEIEYLIPLSDLIIDFFDRLKSITEGYASLDYEFFDYQPVKVVKVDILVNKEKVDALSFLVVEDQAQRRSRHIVERLAEAIPRQQFEAPVQAAIGGQIIARADIKAFRKDVTQKLYGGDRSRKDKLLDKQKKGKARLKLIGRVGIPQSAFFDVLKRIS